MRRHLALLAVVLTFFGLSVIARPDRPPQKPAVTTQDEKALRRKATAGDVQSQVALGKLYAAKTDYASAAKWYLKAAQKGSAEAQASLGILYQDGRGVAKNEIEAVRWLLQAAQVGNVLAERHLARAYLNGAGVPKNMTQFLYWLKAAASAGDRVAQYLLGDLYSQPESVRSKFGGLPGDTGAALVWLSKSAEQGEARAQFRLGEIYTKGTGVPVDFVTSYRWFLCARALGDNRRKKFVDALPDKMSSAQVVEAERQASDWWASHPNLAGKYRYVGDDTPTTTSASPAGTKPQELPDTAPSSKIPTLKRSGDCESGYWIKSVSDDGGIVILEDESVWRVGEIDQLDSMLWLPADDVIACSGYLINSGNAEKVSAVRLR